MGKYFKTTITIYTDYNPEGQEIEILAKQATDGDAICHKKESKPVTGKQLPEGVASFFGITED